jgi:hypothetical protein
MTFDLDKPDAGARFLLAFLIAHHPALFSIEELVREFSGQMGADMQTYVDEGLAELAGAGLVNQLNQFVFASRAAVRSHVLAS